MTGRKPFVLMRYNKWTTICKNKMSLLKQVYCAIKQGCLFYDCVRGYMPNRSLVFIMRLTMRSVRDLRPGS